MYKHDVVDYLLNNTVKMKKQTYRCSDRECGCVVTPLWSRFIEAGCNYTKSVQQYALELGLICNVSYEKMCEIIYCAYGVEISRDTLYKFRKKYFKEFTSNIRIKLEELRKIANIEFSDVLSYDEQYVKVMGEWMYKLTAMDSVTGHVYDFCVATKDEFNQEFVKNFLKPLVDEFNINIIVTDEDNMYPAVLNELGVEHQLCGFHIMQTVCKKIIGKIRGYNKKIKNLEDKILKKEVKIKEISELRAGKIGRPSKEEQALIDEKNNLKRENHQNNEEIVKLTNELKEYGDAKDYVSDMIKPKSKQAGRNRCTRFVNSIDERPKELRGFINNLPNKIEQILLHTEYDDVTTNNNIIELYHVTTLNRHDKKKYKTIGGVMEETLLKTLRWEKRVVLGIC